MKGTAKGHDFESSIEVSSISRVVVKAVKIPVTVTARLIVTELRKNRNGDTGINMTH